MLKYKFIKFIVMLPLIVFMVIGIVSYNNGLLFEISSTGQLIKGKIYFAFLAFIYGYLIACSIMSLIIAITTKKHSRRKKYYLFAVFVMFPLVFGILNLFIPDSNLIEIGITLSVLFIYIIFQRGAILIDDLTKLNNKNALLKYLSRKVVDDEKNNQIHVVIMDINDFKKINDKYGHIEGDECLVWFSDILKSQCDKKSIFLARYGGDEFIAVYDTKDENDVIELCDGIQKEIDLQNKAKQKEYNLSVSIGYAKYETGDKDIKNIIERADNNMYKAKSNKPTV